MVMVGIRRVQGGYTQVDGGISKSIYIYWRGFGCMNSKLRDLEVRVGSVKSGFKLSRRQIHPPLHSHMRYIQQV